VRQDPLSEMVVVCVQERVGQVGVWLRDDTVSDGLAVRVGVQLGDGLGEPVSLSVRQ